MEKNQNNSNGTPFKSRYKHEMFFDKHQTLKKPKNVSGFDYQKSLAEIQHLEANMDMIGKSSYSHSFANNKIDEKVFTGKNNMAKKHNHDAPYHHLHTLDPYMRTINQ